jgi:hypothetical protein
LSEVLLPVEKISASLRQRLESAEVGETITALVYVRLEDTIAKNSGSNLEARQFESRAAYRAALIEQHQRHSAPTIDTIREALFALGLHPRGGESGTFVVHGEANDILRAAQLSPVVRIDENSRLTLINPL